jgi:glycosyltransferase involved in cell wall biosynthesis
MVVLEAIAFGLPVIATRSYAIPEMVEHGKNGFLIEPPFPYYQEDGRAVKENWNRDLSIRIRTERYPEVENALYDAMDKMMDQDLRISMSNYSKLLFARKFLKEIRDLDFLRVFEVKA